MPQVPFDQNRHVLPDAFQSAETVHASPEDFGAGVGRALQGLGQAGMEGAAMLAAHAKRMEAEQRQNALTQAGTSALTAADQYLYDPQQGLLARKGQDAVDAWGKGGADFTAQSQKWYADATKGMSEEDKRAFAPTWARIRQQAWTSAASHVAAEQRGVWRQTQVASAQAAIDSVGKTWNSNQVMGDAIVQARKAALALGGLDRLDPTRAPTAGDNAQTRAWVDRMWQVRLSAMAERDAPGALKLLESALAGHETAQVRGHDGKPATITLVPPTALEAQTLRAALTRKAAEQNARGIAEGAVQWATAPQPAGPDGGILAAARRIDQLEGDGPDRSGGVPTTAVGGFTAKTWTGYMDRLHPQLRKDGLTDQQILGLRSDKGLRLEATAAYAADNAAALRRAGLPVTAGSLRLAHMFDGPVAAKLIQADPKTPVEKLLPAADVAANPSLKGKTAGEVVAAANKAMEGVVVKPPPFPPTQAQLVERHYGEILQRVKEQTAADPELQERALAKARTRMAEVVEAQRMEDLGNEAVVNQAVVEGHPTSLEQLRADPKASAAYDALVRSQPAKAKAYQAVFEANAAGQGDPAVSRGGEALWYELRGQAETDPQAFARLPLMDYYGKMPLAQWQSLARIQARLKSPAAKDAVRQMTYQHAMSIIAPMAMEAGVAMHVTDKSPPAARKTYAQLYGRMTEAVDRFEAVNKRPPRPDEVLQIGRALLLQGAQRGTGWLWDDTVRDFQAPAGTFYLPVPEGERDKVASAYRKVFGREPSKQDVEDWYTRGQLEGAR